MSALTRRRLLVSTQLRARPAIASLFSPDDVDEFLDTDAPVCIVANGELLRLESVVARMAGADRFAFINADTVSGLAPDRGGIDFLAKIGAAGVVTTRAAMIARIEQHGMLAMQKLFITDRLNLPRSTHGLEGSQPSFVQIMPAPVLPYILDEPVMRISPVIAGGFVANERSLEAAIACGAAGVSTSERTLWTYRKNQS
ncbi:glycerol-3-phosphate responsive antiterminator [Agrococcus pavilionensis]|uniref:glycerol-3-phosphate responsive antiterminator n=1 Tax=Agrococcus pavilionensis TaxID=1346502 RepID=UPI0009DBCA9E|nr:glycerol-3-phosphate responsive antiterminator [Agrococcus pavilionensis]